MKELKEDKDIVRGNNVLLFMTPNCNPCKNMKIILEKLESSHKDKADFYFINTPENPKLSEKYRIKSVPTTVFKKDEQIKDRFAGFIEDIELENKLMDLLYDFSSESGGFETFNDLEF